MFLDPILNFFGASANTLKYARDYMEIILYGNVITHLYFGLNSIIRSSGNPKMAMGLTLFTVILNSIPPDIHFHIRDGCARSRFGDGDLPGRLAGIFNPLLHTEGQCPATAERVLQSGVENREGFIVNRHGPFR